MPAAIERILHQRQRLRPAIEREEGSHSRPFRLAKKHLIQALEPRPQIFISGGLAGGIDSGLYGFGIGVRRQSLDGGHQRRDMRRLLGACRAVGFVRAHHVLIVIHRIADHPVKLGMSVSTDPGDIVADIAPDHFMSCKTDRRQVQKQRYGSACRPVTPVRICQPGFQLPGGILFGHLGAVVFVDCLRNHFKMQSLARRGCAYMNSASDSGLP